MPSHWGAKRQGKLEVTQSFESYDPNRDPTMRPTPFQAYVAYSTGCDKFCTYCIVPSVRGPEQGRHPDHILAEVKATGRPRVARRSHCWGNG